MRFQVGDEVRIINFDGYVGVEYMQKGIIIKTNERQSLYSVKFGNYPEGLIFRPGSLQRISKLERALS